MKKIICKTLQLLLLTAAVLTFCRLTVYAENDGWVTKSGHTYYYVNGEKVTGFYKIDKKTYYFNTSNGRMMTGLYKIDGNYYYFSTKQKIKGVMQTGWQTIDGATFYFAKKTGAMLRDRFASVGGTWYLFGEDGQRQTGWQTIDGVKHYFDPESFAAVNGLRKIGRYYYAFSGDGKGARVTGWQTFAGKPYYFNTKNGRAYTGFTKIADDHYLFGADGAMLTGWQTADGIKRCFNGTNGKMYANLVKKVGSYTYYFGPDGRCLTGWQTADGKTYHFQKSTGRANRGLVKIGSYAYYFNKNGEMQTGWQTAEGSRRYFASKTGRMVTDTLKKIGKYYYLFDKNGKLKTGWQTVGEDTYHFASNGKAHTGLRAIGIYYYYFSDAAVRQYGKQTIGGYTCVFHKTNGKLLKSVTAPAGAAGLYTADKKLIVTDGSHVYGNYTVTLDGFELQMKEAGFPDSYLPGLRILHERYPNWQFLSYDPGVTWEEAVDGQYMFDYDNSRENIHISYLPKPWYGTKAVSLVSVNEGHPDSWFSQEVRLSDGSYATGFDGDEWTIASKALIRYYLDPRNFMDPDGKSFFQFLDLNYDASQTAAAVKKGAVSMGSEWLSRTDYPHQNGDVVNYPKLVYNAGKSVGMNPIALVSIMTQEMGQSIVRSDGTEKPAVSGTDEFTVYMPAGKTEVRSGYFNYFYIGGYADGTYNAWQRALWYASGAKDPATATSYGRLWNTRQKAITGGAMYFYNNYVSRGQNTLYLKRFNNNHNQYCTNIGAAWSEGWLLGKAYSEELRTSTTLKFYIPVYKGMPSETCPRPE